MPPTSMDDLLGQALGLVSRSFGSIFSLLDFAFTTLIHLSPLPDEVDFLLVCIFLIWLVSFLIRVLRGKNS
jgi:hypothetical protein